MGVRLWAACCLSLPYAAAAWSVVGVGVEDAAEVRGWGGMGVKRWVRSGIRGWAGGGAKRSGRDIYY